MPVTPNKKLFRAIVILGAAIAQQGCDDMTRCHHCSPPAPDAVANNDANTSQTDGGVGDAMTDAFIAIL